MSVGGKLSAAVLVAKAGEQGLRREKGDPHEG